MLYCSLRVVVGPGCFESRKSRSRFDSGAAALRIGGVKLHCEALHWLGSLAQILRRSRFQLGKSLAFDTFCEDQRISLLMTSICKTNEIFSSATSCYSPWQHKF